MPDYRHDLTFGAFITPSAKDPELTVALAAFAEQVGFDLVTFQDHPYLPNFLDTWTLLSYVAARTERITLSPNVAQPAPASARRHRPQRREPRPAHRRARRVGSRRGRVLGSHRGNGGRRLSPGQAVDALEEAIRVIRDVWADGHLGGVRVEGDYYRVVGAKRGPAPAHDIGIWLGAFKPRMLALVGRMADGWLPSLGYLKGGPADLDGMNEIIDEAAVLAGREPTDVRRLLNIGDRPGDRADHSDRARARDVDVHPRVGRTHGAATVHGGDGPRGPRARRRRPARSACQANRTAGCTKRRRAAPEARGRPRWPGSRRSTTASACPHAPHGTRAPVRSRRRRQPTTSTTNGRRTSASTSSTSTTTSAGSSRPCADLVEQVKAGALGVGDARSAINEMTMRQNDWTLGAYCASYCRVVTGHHSLEDAEVFPHLRRADPGLAPVIDRLHEEHLVIHDVLEEVDAALGRLRRRLERLTALEDALDLLSDTLLSHLAYEEQQIVEPLARLGFYAGQL